MQVTGVRSLLYEHDTSRLLGDVNTPKGRKRHAALVVYLDTDTELTGIGLGTPAARPHIEALTQVLVGRDPRGVRGLWKMMTDAAFKVGVVGPLAAGISVLDMALWDLKAKANDEPLWKTLGAAEPRVRAYASGLDMPLSDEQLQGYYEHMASQGVSAGKLKGGADPDDDLRRIEIMQRALATSGKPVMLMLDVNEHLTPKQAIRHVHTIEDNFDLTWIEEPARRWDSSGLRQISQAVRASVASGENLQNPGEFCSLLDERSVDVVQVGTGTAGLTGSIIVGDMAYGIERPVSGMNSPGNLFAHVAAAMPNHTMLEVLAAGHDALFDINITLADGFLELGDRPGIGIEFDVDRLMEHVVESPSREAGPSPYGRRHDAGLHP